MKNKKHEENYNKTYDHEAVQNQAWRENLNISQIKKQENLEKQIKENRSFALEIIWIKWQWSYLQ